MSGRKSIEKIFLVLAAFTLCASNTAAQNLTEMGTTVTEATAGSAAKESDAFIVESLNDSVPVNAQVAQMVDESRIPKIPMESSTYTLGATDVVEITVMRHPEVSGEYMINQEGKIQYEFVGDIKIAGLTKDRAAEVIAKRLEEYVISPEVNVKITGYNSKIVYVVGEVANPGKIYMRGDTITVREALMQAGLPMLSGVTKKSRLITPSETGKGVRKEINVYALLYEGDLRENDTMFPGDVLYIPATFLTKAMRAINPIAQPIGTAAGTGRTVTTGF